MDGILSNSQFYYLAKKAMNTGFSVKAFGPNAGKRAAYTYLVGTAGHGSDVEPSSAITGKHVKDYALSKEDVLSQPDMYLGGWKGGDPERASLDVTRGMPSTLKGKKAALTAMIYGNQEAAGHVMRPNTYTQIDNPFYDKEQPQTGRDLSPAEEAWVHEQTFPLGRRVQDLFR